mgnify:CR=1 FL=1
MESDKNKLEKLKAQMNGLEENHQSLNSKVDKILELIKNIKK